MLVSVFNGSPRVRAGNTDVIVQAFLRGAERAEAETRTVYLIEEDIGHCMGCFHCWFKTPGRCVRRDGMDDLLELYRRSQIVGFATPVYTWNMTAALKNFVDRLTPLKSPVMTQCDGHYDLEDTEKKETAFVAIANAGFPGEGNFDTIRQVFAPCNPVLEIYRNCSILMKNGTEKIRDIVLTYLQHVENAGFELVTRGAASEKTARELARDLVSAEEYAALLGM